MTVLAQEVFGFRNTIQMRRLWYFGAGTHWNTTLACWVQFYLLSLCIPIEQELSITFLLFSVYNIAGITETNYYEI